MLSVDKAVQTIRNMGMRDSVICLHSSFRSFGPVEGGPQTIIDSFLELGNTLLVPTFTYNCEAPPPAGKSYSRNGFDSSIIHVYGKVSFEGYSSQISHLMGAIPATLICNPASIRSGHPINSFAALGPLAAEIIKEQSLLNVYAPYKYIYKNIPNSYVVMAGTGLKSCTPIHFAEEMAGIKIFRRWAVLEGETVEIEVGSCSKGFENLTPALTGIEKKGRLGASELRIFPFKEFIEILAGVIKSNPTLPHCTLTSCPQCNDKAKGGFCI